MNKTELLNKLAAGPEERLVLARAMDKLELARTRSVPAHTPFLTLAEQEAVGRLCAASGRPEHLFWGGYDGAERAVCAFLPPWQEAEDWKLEPPLLAVALTFPAGSGLTHRDFLGAILGLGVTREKVGDLLVSDGLCQAVVLEELAPVLLSQLEQVGRARVRAAPLPLSMLSPPPQEVRVVRDTVAALRLDAVAAAGFSTSRGKMAEAIAAGRVSVNGRECRKPDRTLSAGDRLACRGLGKCVLTETPGHSKKGRVLVVLERYV